MPFRNEHVALIKKVGQFDSIRRENDFFGRGIDVSWGVTGSKAVVQAIIFASEKHDESQAKEWLKDHDYKTLAFEKSVPQQEAAALPPLKLASPWEAVGETFAGPDGVQRARFRKEIVRVGTYFQPSEPEKPIVMDHELLGHWVATFAEMKKNGVQVPLLMDPEHEQGIQPDHLQDDQDRNRGWMEEMTIDGDGLFAIFEVIGEDAITSAVRNQVSIVSPTTFTDGTGVTYFRPIRNVALTDHPLIPGLGDWQIAASLSTQKGKETGMIKKLAKALGMSAEDIKDMTEENAGEKLVAAIKQLKDDHKTALKAAGKTVKASLEDPDTKALVDSELEKQKETLTASLGKPKEVDGTMLELAGESRSMKLDALVEAGRITPAVKDKLALVFGEGDVLKASLGRGANADHFKEVFEALSENDPVKLAEQTGAQLLAASLPKPTGDGHMKDEDNAVIQDAKTRRENAKK